VAQDGFVGRLLVLLCVLMISAGTAGAENLSRRAFTDAVAAAATAAIPSAKVTVSADLEYVVRYANGAIATSNLARSYKIYEQEPQSLDDLIKFQIAALLEAGGDANGLPKPERSLIIPVIRDRQWFEQTERRGKEHTPPLGLLAEPLNSELVVVYAEDRPGTLRILSTRSDVGDRAQLHDLAPDNLRILLPKIEMHPRAGGIFLISAAASMNRAYSCSMNCGLADRSKSMASWWLLCRRRTRCLSVARATRLALGDYGRWRPTWRRARMP
jgi:hypothetical protein